MSHSRKQYFEHMRRIREFENGCHDSGDTRDPTFTINAFFTRCGDSPNGLAYLGPRF